MKFFCISVFILVLSFATVAQKPDDVLATAMGHTFKLRDLSPDAQKDVENLPSDISAMRLAVLDKIVKQRVVDEEAKARGISKGKLIADEKAKVIAPKPSEAEITAVYEANREALGDRTLDQARDQIVAYLHDQVVNKAIATIITGLQTKYRFVAGKDVNAANLAATDTVATINGKPITAREFEDAAKLEIYDLRADLSDLIAAELNDTIFQALIADEAKTLGIDPGTLIAREITNKMKDFSDVERVGLEDTLSKRLYAKYQVRILYKAAVPPVQNISVDDDPASGPVGAPVTIVMFSDFQCSACSATHPILKKVMAEFPGKIRFVVRDFPLESIHENGFKAALAAGAANSQGKFFEYTEVLYKHQDALGTESLKKYAAELGLNVKQFELDFNSASVAAEVRKDMADGDTYGINGTPTIYINGVRMRDLSVGTFRAAIERALGK